MKNRKDPLEAYNDSVEIFERSWTFARMTEAEKENCRNALRFPVEQNLLKGSYKARRGILNAVYNAYLIGIGYTGFDWREKSA